MDSLAGTVPASARTRRLLHHDQYQSEARWFSDLYPVPDPSMLYDDAEHMKTFKQLIWDREPEKQLPEYDCTPEDLSKLCGEGTNGRLMMRHVFWIMSKLIKISDLSRSTMCFPVDCLRSPLLTFLKRVKDRGILSHIRYLLLLMAVERKEDGSVSIVCNPTSASHWTVAVVSISDGRIVYCDSLGWKQPENFVLRTAALLKLFQIPNTFWSFFMAHDPSPFPQPHQCVEDCLNYPVQRCFSVGGIVAVIFAARFVLKDGAFQDLIKDKISTHGTFFDQPSHFTRYLRRKVITWFVTGVIDVGFLPEFDACLVKKLNSETNHASSAPPPPRIRKHSDAAVPDIKKTMDVNLDAGPQENRGVGSEALDTQDGGVDSETSTGTGNTNSEPTNLHMAHSSGCGPLLSGNDTTMDGSYLSGLLRRSGHIYDFETFAREVCPYCFMQLPNRRTTLQHIRSRHVEKDQNRIEKQHENSIRRRRFPYHCCVCKARLSDAKAFSWHYWDVHFKTAHIFTKHFSDKKQFAYWKIQLEERSQSKFVQERGCRVEKDQTVINFSCHGSGTRTLKPDSDQKKADRRKGSYKTSGKCAAFMEVFLSNDGNVQVDFCVDHVGHNGDLNPWSLTREQMKTIQSSQQPGREKCQKQQKTKDMRDSILSFQRELKTKTKQEEFSNLVRKIEDCDTVKSMNQHLDSALTACRQPSETGGVREEAVVTQQGNSKTSDAQGSEISAEGNRKRKLSDSCNSGLGLKPMEDIASKTRKITLRELIAFASQAASKGSK